MSKDEEMLAACVKLRDVLDVDRNPGMIGSPIEVVLQAESDIRELRAENDQLRDDLREANRMLDKYHSV